MQKSRWLASKIDMSAPYVRKSLFMNTKPNSETNTAFIPAKGEDKITAYCNPNELLYTGGYYIEKDSTLIITKKQSITPNDYEVRFTNSEEFSQYAYVFVDCV